MCTNGSVVNLDYGKRRRSLKEGASHDVPI